MPSPTPNTIQTGRNSDFALDMAPHPVTKDVSLVLDDNAIKQSLNTLFQLKPNEKLFQSDVYSPLYSYLFELATPITESLLRDAIIQLANNREPRIRVQSVSVKARSDESGYDIKFFYKTYQSGVVKKFDFFLERLK